MGSWSLPFRPRSPAGWERDSESPETLVRLISPYSIRQRAGPVGRSWVLRPDRFFFGAQQVWLHATWLTVIMTAHLGAR